MTRFDPRFTISPKTASALVRIEAVRQRLEFLPMNPSLLLSLRESARLYSTHYSTMIEGNRLTHEQVEKVVCKAQRFPGRKRDEAEVKGYYAALHEMESMASRKGTVTELMIQTLHGLVMGGGKKRVKPTPYRESQNVIRDSALRAIVYLPPEAKDVPMLMKQLTKWLRDPGQQVFPCAIRAAIAHYQFATIHPYLDGNGRTARLLTSLVLHLGGYDLQGLYSLEEYYATNLAAYYEAISIGPSDLVWVQTAIRKRVAKPLGRRWIPSYRGRGETNSQICSGGKLSTSHRGIGGRIRCGRSQSAFARANELETPRRSIRRVRSRAPVRWAPSPDHPPAAEDS